MQKLLILAYSICCVSGCRNTDVNTGPDMAVPAGSDLSVTVDMARNYTAASIHDIDVNANPVGPLSSGKGVTITDVIAVSTVNYFKSKKSTICTYELFVQDPACTTPPCGMVVQIDGPMVMQTPPACPKAAMSATILANVHLGDKLTASGLINLFQKPFTDPVDGGATATFTQHALDLTSVQVSASGQSLPAPIAITTPAILTHITGSGWQMYEGTRVILSGLTVTSIDKYGNFTTDPADIPWGSSFDNNYRFVFEPDAGAFLSVGRHYTSITGVVSTLPVLDGAQLLPVSSTDFVP